MQVERQPVHDGAEPALQPLGPLEADVAERSNVVAPDRDRVLRHGDSLPGRRRPADVERRCSDAPRRPRAARSDRRPLGDRVCCHGPRSAHGLASPTRPFRTGGRSSRAARVPGRGGPLSSRSSSAAEPRGSASPRRGRESRARLRRGRAGAGRRSMRGSSRVAPPVRTPGSASARSSRFPTREGRAFLGAPLRIRVRPAAYEGR